MATLKRGSVKSSGTSKDRTVKGYSVDCGRLGIEKGAFWKAIETWKFLVKAASQTIGAQQLLCTCNDSEETQ